MTTLSKILRAPLSIITSDSLQNILIDGMRFVTLMYGLNEIVNGQTNLYKLAVATVVYGSLRDYEKTNFGKLDRERLLSELLSDLESKRIITPTINKQPKPK
ncbi:hypothetical protein HY450_03205 [Candidatus Pacearchaeota archaeon]|nr:hypothetical protein [Candidatus Pacearchaeota archaeon]